MKKGQLVFHKEFGRGIISKISPSGFIILVRFKNFMPRQVINGSLQLIK